MINPFPPFIPPDAHSMILGSFPPLSLVERAVAGPRDIPFYYGSSQSQMWSIMEQVYDVVLRRYRDDGSLDKEQTVINIKGLLTRKRIAIADIILECHRRVQDSDDNNIIIDGFTPLDTTMSQHPSIRYLYFTSLYVEKHFKKQWPSLFSQLECSSLPSPSPRARGSVAEKAGQYKRILKKP